MSRNKHFLLRNLMILAEEIPLEYSYLKEQFVLKQARIEIVILKWQKHLLFSEKRRMKNENVITC